MYSGCIMAIVTQISESMGVMTICMRRGPIPVLSPGAVQNVPPA